MTEILVKTCPICGSDGLEHRLTVLDHSISGEEFEIVGCPNCGMGITQPQPIPADIGRYYESEDYISHSNTSKGLVNNLYHRVRKYMLGQKRKLVESYAHTGKLLDIGAGTGYFIHHMRTHGWDVTGLEPDASAREVGRTELGVSIHDTAVMSELGASSYDVITMWHVLEHVHDLNHQFKEIQRLLAPDGTLVIAVPNPTSSDARKYGSYWAGYDVPRHLWHFSPESMEELFDKHGFRLVKMQGMPFDAFYVSLLSEKYKQNGLGLVTGGFAGLSTNLKAISDNTKASSLIYVGKRS